ncbi:protease FtsH subunit HflK [Halanaerobium saccharolyticum]|uniref:Beta-glucuronidase n=1 Tax=Halanaerobium saccharolyticum TaxID=43595 RepID=A0A4R7YMW4_9FIRM|nr:glycoside hydrolase family 2 TIM barrel-domain containing protein [Halanaerobium saccharolyticum]RAK05175.1 protease FtsH subunit HflK [Halanaerobium saccharolyticum]TDV99006.1 protease FtsH subunit HflK [Halanaerobium saccharolyticum]TDX51697.1 protease FtsH subunit HflK [Halanaerobium saccharolyticum]
MEKNSSDNFVSDIHDEDYKTKYFEPLIDHNSLIYDINREKESLNGSWNFQIDQYDTFLRASWYKNKKEDQGGREYPQDHDFNNWEEIKVPACWNTQSDKYLYYEGPAVYSRDFKYINHGEKRVFLKLGAANYDSYIFLNKKFLGHHQGGSTPFMLEVTEELEKENSLQIVVDNTRRREAVPTTNTDWFNYGGLYRDVELLRLPDSYIKDFSLSLAEDSLTELDFGVEVAGLISAGEAELKIPELNIEQTITVKNGSGKIIFAAQPELWSPDNPKLYKVIVSFGRDKIEEEIGLRQISVQGRDIYLNGEKIYLKGISTHEESVSSGKAVTEAEIIENIKLAKEMNCNYIRLAHYPHSYQVAKIADQMGVMLWEEIPVYWAIDFANPMTCQDAENQLLELIKRDHNRASVIIWSVGNENQDTDQRLKFMSDLVKKAREVDPTRLISAACLVDEENNRIADRLTEYLDIIGQNEYYGWYEPDFSKLSDCMENSKPDKPVIITEFGAGALSGERGTKDDLFTEDYQLQVYQKQTEVLDDIEYIKGLSPWILFDFRCPRRTNKYQKGYNRKGLLSADKSHKKLAFYEMQRYYSKK